jgi:very-short-patch-repair endonuclease
VLIPVQYLMMRKLFADGGAGKGGDSVRPEGAQPTPERRPCRKRRSLARGAVQIARARGLRQKETESEQVAWRLLRTLRFKGFTFRRQHAVGLYIVDFCCPQRRLIVELDGSVHAQPSQTRREKRRDAQLKDTGYTVARFPNGMVLEAPELFVEKVLNIAWSLPDAFADKS